MSANVVLLDASELRSRKAIEVVRQADVVVVRHPGGMFELAKYREGPKQRAGAWDDLPSEVKRALS